MNLFVIINILTTMRKSLILASTLSIVGLASTQ